MPLCDITRKHVWLLFGFVCPKNPNYESTLEANTPSRGPALASPRHFARGITGPSWGTLIQASRGDPTWVPRTNLAQCHVALTGLRVAVASLRKLKTRSTNPSRSQGVTLTLRFHWFARGHNRFLLLRNPNSSRMVFEINLCPASALSTREINAPCFAFC